MAVILKTQTGRLEGLWGGCCDVPDLAMEAECLLFKITKMERKKKQVAKWEQPIDIAATLQTMQTSIISLSYVTNNLSSKQQTADSRRSVES